MYSVPENSAMVTTCCPLSDLLISTIVLLRLDPPSGTVVQQTDITIRECIVSDRNVACALLIRHNTLSDGEVSVLP